MYLDIHGNVIQVSTFLRDHIWHKLKNEMNISDTETGRITKRSYRYGVFHGFRECISEPFVFLIALNYSYKYTPFTQQVQHDRLWRDSK